MEAAARGARAGGGLTVGVLPAYDAGDANAAIDVAIPTGLGYARNVVVVAAGDAVIALPGGAGTASEIALARVLGRPVVGLAAWEGVSEVHCVPGALEAVETALRLGESGRR